MKNNLLLLFEDEIIKKYTNTELDKYLLFIKKRVEDFTRDFDLNLIISYSDDFWFDKIKANFLIENSKLLKFDKSLISLFENYLKNIDNSSESYTLIISASYPLFSIKENIFMLDDAQKNFVDYYYGEHFPEGVIGQVVKNRIFKEITKLTRDSDRYYNNCIFDIILRNITNFDIDLIEGFSDYLPYRTSLSINELANLPTIASLCKTDFDINNPLSFITKTEVLPDWEKIKADILKNPQILYTFPRTYIIELSSDCTFNCIHCARKNSLQRTSKFIDKDNLFSFVEKNKAYLKDSIFLFGGFGEPFSHPQFFEITNFLSKNNRVIIETNGSYLTNDLMDKFISPSNINIVVSLDAITEERYRSLGKKMMFQLLLQTVKQLLEKYPENIYISFVRMTANDFEVEEFYEYFKEYEKNIIFRKFNSYSKSIENMEVADLTPPQRFACFHVRREAFILSDGSFSLCYSDYNKKILDLCISDDFDKILTEYKNQYFVQLKENYPEICKDCNEFYTYFF
jgi:spiro-SPASM protein